MISSVIFCCTKTCVSVQIIAAQEEMLRKERELEDARRKLAQIRQQQYKFLPSELREDNNWGSTWGSLLRSRRAVWKAHVLNVHVCLNICLLHHGTSSRLSQRLQTQLHSLLTWAPVCSRRLSNTRTEEELLLYVSFLFFLFFFHLKHSSFEWCNLNRMWRAEHRQNHSYTHVCPYAAAVKSSQSVHHFFTRINWEFNCNITSQASMIQVKTLILSLLWSHMKERLWFCYFFGQIYCESSGRMNSNHVNAFTSLDDLLP